MVFLIFFPVLGIELIALYIINKLVLWHQLTTPNPIFYSSFLPFFWGGEWGQKSHYIDQTGLKLSQPASAATVLITTYTVWVYVHIHTRLPETIEVRIALEVKGSSENLCCEFNLNPLQEQYVFLTTEPCLESQW